MKPRKSPAPKGRAGSRDHTTSAHRDTVRPEAVRELVAARRGDDVARVRRAEQALIVEYLPVASAIARRGRRNGVDMEDLRQVASIGLVKAIRAWQPQKGPLLGYLVPTVRGEIRRYFRDSGAMIRMPRSLYESQPSVAAARRRLRQEFGREPSSEEVAHAAQLPREQVRQIETAIGACHPSSTDEHADWLGSLTSQAAQTELTSADLRAVLRPAMARLTARERRIIALRFIWGQSQLQIANALGLSQMHISRLLSASLRKLREALETAGGAGGIAAGAA